MKQERAGAWIESREGPFTLAELARAAGCSLTTASRVINMRYGLRYAWRRSANGGYVKVWFPPGPDR